MAEGGGRPAIYLVVDDDERVRGMVRLGFELEGATVIEADSLVGARQLLTSSIRGIVLDRQLPDGDGLDLLPDIARLSPSARVVVSSALHDGREPEGLHRVEKSDIAGLVSEFGFGDRAGGSDRAALGEAGEGFRDTGRLGDAIRGDLHELAAEWAELCRWDPELPIDATPASAHGFVASLADALDRPQPLGWGVDPAMEQAAETLASGVSSVAAGIGQLVCLREALTRRLLASLPLDVANEVLLRATMALERAMGCMSGVVCARLEEEAFVDVLTELPNRRAFQRDLARQLAWAARSHNTVALVLVDMDGLKAVNELQGYAAGDARLRSLGDALLGALRAGDGAYRIGGDEFVALLPDSPPSQVPAILRRVVRLAAPPFSWGVATYPTDGGTAEELLDAAHDELARGRGRPRGAPEAGAPEAGAAEAGAPEAGTSGEEPDRHLRP